MLRSKLIAEIADRIVDLELDHPVRVGVSGITASGKTTLANELAAELQCRQRDVIRTSIDYFHNPRHIRYRQGKESAIGYYEDAHDYESFKNKLLIPLGPNGSLYYQTMSLDLAQDVNVDSKIQIATKDMIVIIDGTFLLKRELQDFYDFKIYVDTDFAIARNRGAQREALAFGGYEKAEAMFLNRYHAASQLYVEEHAPKHCADIVVNNNDISNPYFVACTQEGGFVL